MTDKQRILAEMDLLKQQLLFIETAERMSNPIQEEPKFKVGDIIRRKDDGLVVEVIDVHDNVTTVRCEDWDNTIIEKEWELVKEPKKCLFTQDHYTDEDRKVLREDCDEDCEYSKKEEPSIVIVLNGQRHRQVWHKGCFSKKECKEKCSLYESCQRCSIDLCMIFFHDPHCHFEKNPVSEDFEAEWKEYFKYRGDIATVNIKDLAKHFANWQKEKMLLNNDEYQTVPVATLDRLYASEKKLDQMMKNAMEATVTDIRTYKHENEVDFTIMLDKGIIPYETEEELKLIIIKED